MLLQNAPTVFQDSRSLRTFRLAGGRFKLRLTDCCSSNPPPTTEVHLSDVEDQPNVVLSVHPPSRDPVTIRIARFGDRRMGGSFWLSSIAMLIRLADADADAAGTDGVPGALRGKHVVELGAGCAAPSIFVSSVAADSVVLATDADVAPAEACVAANAANCGLRVQRLDWNNDSELVDVSKAFAGRRIDMLIACDCVYRGSAPAVAAAIKALDPAQVLVYNAVRDGIDEFCYAMLEAFPGACDITRERLVYAEDGDRDAGDRDREDDQTHWTELIHISARSIHIVNM